MKCEFCLKEISTEQHGKYYKRCPACYQQYKIQQARWGIASGIIWIGVSSLWGAMFFAIGQSGPFHTRSVLVAIASLMTAQVNFFKAWSWKYTEVVHWRYDKKGIGMKVALNLPIILVIVVVVAAFFVPPFSV